MNLLTFNSHLVYSNKTLWVFQPTEMKINTTIFQSLKFILVGGSATIADLIIFDLLIWIITPNLLVAKSISFVIATGIKYGGNKYWTFQNYHNEKIQKEIIQFFVITLVALAIDLCTFYYATKVWGPHFGLSQHLWSQASVVIAALSSAVVSFLGYKFLVFKK